MAVNANAYGMFSKVQYLNYVYLTQNSDAPVPDAKRFHASSASPGSTDDIWCDLHGLLRVGGSVPVQAGTRNGFGTPGGRIQEGRSYRVFGLIRHVYMLYSR